MFDYSREQIKNALDKHPKDDAVKLGSERIEEIKSNPLLKGAFESLENCKKFYKDRPLYAIPFSMFKRYEKDGDRSEFEYDEKGYFIHRGHLKTWALSALFGDDEEDIARLEDTMWAICDEFTWALPAHMSGNQGIYVNYQPDRYTIDLFAAETGQALAEIIQLLGDKLNPLVVKRAKAEIKKRIIDRFLYGEVSDFWWARCTNNWAAVCGGSVGMAAICESEDNDKLADITVKLLESMRTFMNGFSSDGACLEGTGYWNYGFGYFSCFADMLYRRTGGEINLFDDEKVHLVAMFPLKTFFYGSRTVSFSDSGSYGSLGLGLITMLSTHYPDMVVPSTAKMGEGVEVTGCHRFALNLRSFVWCGKESPASSDELHIYPLPDAQWYIANGKANFGFAAKGGNNNEPHNHNDIGHFIVYKNGDEFFTDLGSGEYSRQYFGKERYTFAHCGSQGHSVPIINGKTQVAGKDAFAENVTVDENGIKMNYEKAYREETLKTLYREFVFDKEKTEISIKDRFEFDKVPESVTERFVTRVRPEVCDGVINLETSKGKVSMKYDADKFDVTVIPNEVGDHMGKPFTYYSIDLCVKAPQKSMEFGFSIN